MSKSITPTDYGIWRVIKGVHDGKLLIDCQNKQDNEKIMQKASSALGQVVKVPNKRNP